MTCEVWPGVVVSVKKTLSRVLLMISSSSTFALAAVSISGLAMNGASVGIPSPVVSLTRRLRGSPKELVTYAS